MRRYQPARDLAGHLTDAGRELMSEMKLLGTLLVVMHLVEPAIWEVRDAIAGPAIVSYGGARGVIDPILYLVDEQIWAMTGAGGFLGASPTPIAPSLERPGLHLLLETGDYMTLLSARATLASLLISIRSPDITGRVSQTAARHPG